jgi:hypothetical protein
LSTTGPRRRRPRRTPVSRPTRFCRSHTFMWRGAGFISPSIQRSGKAKGKRRPRVVIFHSDDGPPAARAIFKPLIAGLCGLLILVQNLIRPLRYGKSRRFETMPSRRSLHACDTIAPQARLCPGQHLRQPHLPRLRSCLADRPGCKDKVRADTGSSTIISPTGRVDTAARYPSPRMLQWRMILGQECEQPRVVPAVFRARQIRPGLRRGCSRLRRTPCNARHPDHGAAARRWGTRTAPYAAGTGRGRGSRKA